MIVLAIKDLIQEAPFAMKFGLWDFGDGTPQPGVFTIDPAPEKAPGPVCVVVQMGGPDIETDVTTRGRIGQIVQVNVRVWGDDLRSDKGLRVLAWEVYGLFFGKGKSILSITDWRIEHHRITAPQRFTDVKGFPGYTMTITVIVSRERS